MEGARRGAHYGFQADDRDAAGAFGLGNTPRPGWGRQLPRARGGARRSPTAGAWLCCCRGSPAHPFDPSPPTPHPEPPARRPDPLAPQGVLTGLFPDAPGPFPATVAEERAGFMYPSKAACGAIAPVVERLTALADARGGSSLFFRVCACAGARAGASARARADARACACTCARVKCRLLRLLP